ncbi:MAG: DUF4147 domain-containing protein [Phycisphaerales bacterium]|nr:MAG: DUF4147 domain-containing protein [Phycisphaerales bacterium]
MSVSPLSGWAGDVAREVLAACDPAGAVDRAWAGRMEGDGRVGVIAFGKASAPMAVASCARLADRCIGGVVLAPEDHTPRVPTVLEAFPVDHPLPTARNAHASERLAGFVRTMPEDATLLALVSGGGSAHLMSPMRGLTIHDLRETTDALLRAGATIGEINTVRKHADGLKGGRLARLACGIERVVQFTVSDVIGDDLATIASGPLVGDGSTFADALGVLDHHRLGSGIAEAEGLARVRVVLTRGVRGEMPEAARADEACVARVEHVVVASNALAVDAAVRTLRSHGTEAERSGSAREGEAATVARSIVRSWGGRTRAVVWGGETTVRVGDAGGRGGRVQEMMLVIALEMERLGLRGRALGLATDGLDGPTDVAGAVVDSGTCARVRAAGIDPVTALAAHDSYAALRAGGASFRTGATGTNVNDVVVICEEARV